MRPSWSSGARLFGAILGLVASSRPALAGEITLRNGDHITGKVLTLADGELTFKSDGAGELTVDVNKLKTFSSTELLDIRLTNGAAFESQIGAGPDGKVQIRRSPRARTELVAILDIAEINPPAPAWSGEVSLNGKITGGNSEVTEAGIDLTLDKEWTRDRLHFTGEYFYGNERDPDTGDRATTDDFGDLYGKYAHDLRDKVYLHVNAKVLHDALAELQYRVSPAVGVGYRWSDTYRLELFTDIGVAYNHEDFYNFGGRSFWGPQLEYGVDWKPVTRLKLSHTLEYYPSFSDFSGNYLLDTDAGIEVNLSKHIFVTLRAEYHHDTEPAPSAKTGEYRFLLGPGWKR